MFTQVKVGTMRYSPALVLALATNAHAGGLTLPVQGVRSLERAGAFIAGADDADALWLDPAGLAHTVGAGHQTLLFDVAYVYQPVDFTASPGMIAANQQPGAPAPQLAGAYGIDDHLVLGAGISTPYETFHTYDVAGPARYASTSMATTNFVRVTFGAAYALSPRLRVGATIEDNVTILKHQIVASACPGTMTCDRSYDMPIEIKETDYVSPSGSVGVQLEPADGLTLGAAFHAPARVSTSGTLTVSPPPALANATVSGSSGSESFTLPPSVRAGIEYRPVPSLRVEAALDVELWSMHDAITIAPDHVTLGTMALQTMTIPRHFVTSYAPSLGVELHLGAAQLGAGIGYESSAVPPSYVSVLTVDASKVLIGLGGGYAYDGWQIGVAAGYAHLADVTVTDPKVPLLEALHTATTPTFINGGTYHASYWLAGLRLARAM
jgi:long-chain fatty acid transport protein